MPELQIGRDERLALRAQAHALKPVVLLGQAGLSEAVFKEIDRALNAHGLIKVRMPSDDRDDRDAMCEAIADRLGAARVQVIGKLIVLFRPLPAPEPEPAPARRAKAADRRPARKPPARPASKARRRQM